MIVLILDQIAKLLVSSYLKPYEVIPLIGSLLQIRLRFNPFGVWSISFGPSYTYLIVHLVGVALLVYFIIRSNAGFERIFLGIVLGGALGNAFDRIRLGKVVDFIDMGIGDHRWPTYNFSDLAITVGIIGILVCEFFFSRQPNRDKI